MDGTNRPLELDRDAAPRLELIAIHGCANLRVLREHGACQCDSSERDAERCGEHVEDRRGGRAQLAEAYGESLRERSLTE
jgi:hypothetical protein